MMEEKELSFWEKLFGRGKNNPPKTINPKERKKRKKKRKEVKKQKRKQRERR